MENLDPPSPQWSVFPLRAASSLIWGDGGWGLAVPFYSDQDCSFLSNSYMTLGAQSCAVQSWEDACIRPARNKWSPTRALIRGELSQVLPEPHLHSTVHLKYFFGAFAIPTSAANSGTAGKWNKFIKSEIPNREVGRGGSFPLMLLSSYQEPSCSYSFIYLFREAMIPSSCLSRGIRNELHHH